MSLFKKKKRDDNAFLRDIYGNVEIAMSSWMSTLFASRLHELHGIDYALLTANQPTYDENAATPEEFLSTMMTPKTPVFSAWHGPSKTLLNLTFEATLPTPKTVSITHRLRVFDSAAPLTVGADDLEAGRLSEDNLVTEFPKLVNVFTDSYAKTPDCGKVSGWNSTGRLCRVLAHMVDDQDILDLSVPYSDFFSALARKGKGRSSAHNWETVGVS